MVTLTGTVATLVMLLVSAKVAALAGAAANVIVPVDGLPPIRY